MKNSVAVYGLYGLLGKQSNKSVKSEAQNQFHKQTQNTTSLREAETLKQNVLSK